MFNFDYITKEGIKKYNQNWQEILYHPYRILINAPEKTINSINLNLINHKSDINKFSFIFKRSI